MPFASALHPLEVKGAAESMLLRQQGEANLGKRLLSRWAYHGGIHRLEGGKISPTENR